MSFFAFHPESVHSCGSEHEVNKFWGKVLAVEVVHENPKVAYLQVKGTSFRFAAAKWPNDSWGKSRGVFKTKQETQEYLDGPLPRYDYDGKLINKLSKSQL